MAKTQAEISFDATPTERALVRKIARRARVIYLAARVDRSAADIEMDLVATHANGNPMDFEKLLDADDFNLMHDVGGIGRHLNRETGELEDFFSPRFSKREHASA
jgi:hypothetical protein